MIPNWKAALLNSAVSAAVLGRTAALKKAVRVKPGNSDPVTRWFDPFIAQIDLSLPPMMRHVHIHRQQDFPPRKPPVRRIMRTRQLLLRQFWNDVPAIAERIAQEPHDCVFVSRRQRGTDRRRYISQPGTKRE